MTRRRPAGRMRRVSIWLLGGVIALVGLFTIQQANLIEEESARRERIRTVQELSNLVALWEGLIVDRIGSWTTDLAGSPSLARERQLRSTVVWFDAFYQWSPTDGVEWPLATEQAEATVLLDAPCLRDANSLRVMGRKTDAAAAFAACPPLTPAHGLLASFLAARILTEEGRPEAVLDVLASASPPLSMRLADAADAGLDIDMMVQRLRLASDAQEALGREAAREARAVDTIRSVTELDGADLARHIQVAEAGLATLEPTVEGYAELQRRVERARRRVVTFEYVTNSLVPSTEDAAPGEIHLVQDLADRPGILLVWTALDDTKRAAVQVDTSDLLHALRDTLPPSTGVYIVDRTGTPIGPDGRLDAAAGPIQITTSVPLGRLFPHLHVTSVTPPHAGGGLDRILLPLAPLGVSLVLGVLAVWAQITAERREAELNHRQQEFITRVTHELKTPLAGIRVMAETLQLGAAADPATRDQFLDRILQECTNLANRIDEVLSAARKPQVRNVVDISADKLVEAVIERWEPRFTQRDARLEHTLAPTPAISVDIDLMHDAIGNLLDNALKYRRPGIPGLCRVRTSASGRWVLIEVSDNGIGVPPDKRTLVFERFTRVEGPRRGKAGGHGLGLAFVADTADAHGGLVECVDGIDGGACFRIKLPRR